ncbi:MAG: AI-2E family transporter [Planctomycetaceae bacterium]
MDEDMLGRAALAADDPSGSTGATEDHAQEWERRWPPAAYLVRATAAIALTLLTISAARSAADILVLVVIAGVLAIGMDPIVEGLQRRGLGRGRAVALVVLGVTVVLGLFALLVLPPLVRQIAELANDVPAIARRLQARQDWVGTYARANDVQSQVQAFIADLPTRVAASFGTVLGVAGTVGATLFKVLTVAVLTVYLMLALPGIRRTATLLVDPDHRDRAERVVDRSLDRIGGYVSGNLVTSLVCGVTTLVALLLFGVPFAFPLAMWAGLADLIPAVGSYLGAIPAIVVGLIVSPWIGVGVAVFFVLYQQFENYVIVPRVMQDAVNLSPASVIISTLVGGSLAGFAGALLALPVAATMKVVVLEVWLRDRMREGDPLARQRLREERVAEREASLQLPFGGRVRSWVMDRLK